MLRVTALEEAFPSPPLLPLLPFLLSRSRGAPHPAPPARIQHLQGLPHHPGSLQADGVCRGITPLAHARGWEGQDGIWERFASARAEPLPCLLTNRIPRGELTQPSPSSPQQQPGLSQVHIPFLGKWDLYISCWIRATIIMVGFGGYLRPEAALRGGHRARFGGAEGSESLPCSGMLWDAPGCSRQLHSCPGEVTGAE